MARVQATVVVLGRVAEAEELFYDLDRRPTWVDGFGHVTRLTGEWPGEGAKLEWESRPGGRGRVVERVRAHEPGTGQTCDIEEKQLFGTQRVDFATEGDATRVTLSLDYQLAERSPLGPLTGLFVRRALRDSLDRTLHRFAIERESDLHPL